MRAHKKAQRWTPDRGDLIWLNFTPQAGHEQAGRRPAIVLSPASYNSRSNLALVCPITSQQKGYPFEVALPAGLPVQGCILADQVRSIDWKQRDARLIARAASITVAEVQNRVAPLLGF